MLLNKHMGKNTSISLGPHFENFIATMLDAGGYKNASEIIRAGLRLLEEREQKIELLKHALEEGVNSGFVNNFDPEKHLEKLQKAKRKING